MHPDTTLFFAFKTHFIQLPVIRDEEKKAFVNGFFKKVKFHALHE